MTHLAAHTDRRRLAMFAIATTLAMGVSTLAFVPGSPVVAAETGEVSVEYFEYETYAKAVRCTAPCTGTLTIGDQYNGKPVTVIDDAAFYNQAGMTGSVTIPASVTRIGNSAFHGAAGLTGITFAANSSLTEIDALAFENASGLTGLLRIPNSVTTIGAQAFRGVSGLAGLSLGNSVQTIGAGAFRGASSLTGLLEIPNSVTEIGNQAFMNVTQLSAIRFLGERPSTLGTTAFFDSGTAPIYRKLSEEATWATTTELNGHPVVAVAPPTITTQPTDRSLTVGETLELIGRANSEAAAGAQMYGWYKDDVALANPPVNSTVGNYRKTGVTLSDSGQYRFVAASWAGATLSNLATVTVTAGGTGPTPTPEPEPTTDPAPAPAPPSAPPAKSGQSIRLALPGTLKKNRKYSLPKKTTQGQKLTWKITKQKACTVKAATLRCAKPSKGKKYTITGTAPGNANLSAFRIVLNRKVK